MKLMVQSYNNGGSAYNAEAEETAFRQYTISHKFNGAAECTMYLADPTGTIAQKYNVDANDVYLGVGKATLEDPTGTDIFHGRILSAQASTTHPRMCELYCRDWLDQLDEEQVSYDMREDLDGSGLRQSELKSYLNKKNEPVYNAGGNYLYDADMAWAVDQWNGFYVVFPSNAFGDITVTTGPFQDTVSANVDTDTGGFDDLWVDDSNYHELIEDESSFTVDYDFTLNAGTGSLLSAGPTRGYINISFYLVNAEGATRNCLLRIKDADEAWHSIKNFTFTDTTTEIRRERVIIPAQFLSVFEDTDGTATIRFDVEVGAGFATTMQIYYCVLEMDYTLTGYSGRIAVQDTLQYGGAGTYHVLKVDTDCDYSGLGLYEGCPYSIIQPIYKHIDSAETPGALITDGDGLVTLTCAATIEHTTGLSARQYVDKTRMEILQDLARQDNAQFWIALGTTTVTWKSTFDDVAADATLTDADVNAWKMTQDYQTLINSCTVYGMRIGDDELSATYSDATSIAKYNATRTRVIRDSGIVSAYDALQRATATVNQYNEVQKILTASIRGNTATAAHPKTIVLGDEIQITSTFLGLTNAWYVVQRYSYDSRTHMTTLLLHPRVSYGLQADESISKDIASQMARRGGVDRYIPKPVTNTVT